jgi:hypothetical protein
MYNTTNSCKNVSVYDYIAPLSYYTLAPFNNLKGNSRNLSIAGHRSLPPMTHSDFCGIVLQINSFHSLLGMSLRGRSSRSNPFVSGGCFVPRSDISLSILEKTFLDSYIIYSAWIDLSRHLSNVQFLTTCTFFEHFYRPSEKELGKWRSWAGQNGGNVTS